MSHRRDDVVVVGLLDVSRKPVPEGLAELVEAVVSAPRTHVARCSPTAQNPRDLGHVAGQGGRTRLSSRSLDFVTPVCGTLCPSLGRLTTAPPALILAGRARRDRVSRAPSTSKQQPEFGELRQARSPREPSESG